MQFIATYVDANHRYRQEQEIDADDIDLAASKAIGFCPDGSFVAEIKQADLVAAALRLVDLQNA